MELNAPHMIAPHRSRDWYTVIRGSQDSARVLRREGEAVHEVEIGAVRYATEQMVISAGAGDTIPPNMRHAQSATQASKVPHLTRDEA